MASQSYPSPTGAQVGGGAGPFYGQSGLSPSNVPNDLQLIADLSRHAAPMMTTTMNGEQEMERQHHHHIQHLDDGRHPTSPERLAQDVISLSQHHDYQSHSQGQSQADATPNSENSKKRTKVSRACDECRRKKIRCDAVSESPTTPCSNCKRTGAQCQFSRQPMKRGPSKGYIKELADRLNTLENQIHPQQQMSQRQMSQQQMPQQQIPQPQMPQQQISQQMFQPESQYLPMEMQDYSPPGAQYSRKRTLSVSDGLNGGYPLPPRPPPSIWHQDSSRHLPPPSSLQHPQTPHSSSADIVHMSGQRSQMSPNNMVQQMSHEGPLDFSRRDSTSAQGDMDQRIDASGSTQGLDDGVMDEYYRIIHPSLPLLSNAPARLRSRLVHCPPTLRDAFLAALDCAVRSFPSSSLQHPHHFFDSMKRASELIAVSQYEASSNQPMSTHLTYIQTLILMALGSDNHGPAALRGQLGPPRSEWLGRAVGMATHWKLNTFSPRESGDADSDEKLGRRVWWVLFILDRWHASSTSSMLQLQETNTQLLPEDMLILGESTYHLVRLSYILGHLASVLTASTDVMAPSNPAANIVGMTIQGEIDRFRESVESTIRSSNLVHLSYWHVRLLIQSLHPKSETYELLPPAQKVAAILNSDSTPITPLNHHFAALATLTLVQLAGFPETREGAARGISDIQDALDSHRGLYANEDSAGWDSAIRDLIVHPKQRLQSGDAVPMVGLQHLAEAAVGEHKPDSSSNGGVAAGASTSKTGATVSQFDPTLLTRRGYLRVLAEETMAT